MTDAKSSPKSGLLPGPFRAQTFRYGTQVTCVLLLATMPVNGCHLYAPTAIGVVFEVVVRLAMAFAIGQAIARLRGAPGRAGGHALVFVFGAAAIGAGGFAIELVNAAVLARGLSESQKAFENLGGRWEDFDGYIIAAFVIQCVAASVGIAFTLARCRVPPSDNEARRDAALVASARVVADSVYSAVALGVVGLLWNFVWALLSSKIGSDPGLLHTSGVLVGYCALSALLVKGIRVIAARLAEAREVRLRQLRDAWERHDGMRIAPSPREGMVELRAPVEGAPQTYRDAFGPEEAVAEVEEAWLEEAGIDLRRERT